MIEPHKVIDILGVLLAPNSSIDDKFNYLLEKLEK